jgi:hypothetical protein
MIKNSVIIFLVVLTVGCNQKPKRRTIDVNSRQVEIDFAHISVSLPKYFQKRSPDDLIYTIENADPTEISETERQEKIRQYETLKTNLIGVVYYIYVDTTDINNTIVFQKGKYLKLDKEVRQFILSNSEKMLNPGLTADSLTFKRVDSQFFTGEKIQILKQKFEPKRPERTYYTTFYVVTTKSNTFQIIVGGFDSEDFEDRITRMRVGI